MIIEDARQDRWFGQPSPIAETKGTPKSIYSLLKLRLNCSLACIKPHYNEPLYRGASCYNGTIWQLFVSSEIRFTLVITKILAWTKTTSCNPFPLHRRSTGFGNSARDHGSISGSRPTKAPKGVGAAIAEVEIHLHP